MKKELGNFNLSLCAMRVVLVMVLLGVGGGVFTSCNLSDTSNNTVRLVMPGGSARYAISGAQDIDYYNVTINNQKFERLNAGASVESSPITVGATVHITVEAIGSIKNPNPPAVNLPPPSDDPIWWLVQNKRVAYFETTRTMENGGINISVKMKDYVIEYAKITFTDTTSYESNDKYYSNIFANNQKIDWKNEDIVELGKPYKLPDYGIVQFGKEGDWYVCMHIGWMDANQIEYSRGQWLTITEDMLDSNGSVQFSIMKRDPVQLNITDNTNIILPSDGSIYEDNGKYYLWTDQPFTLPKRKNPNGSIEDIDWEANTYADDPVSIGKSGATIDFDEWESWRKSNCLTIIYYIDIKQKTN